jgi:hypothetical protein
MEQFSLPAEPGGNVFRSSVAASLAALAIVTLALIVALVGAVGVALIGLLLSRWFELTQWQGSLLALGALLAVGLLIYRTVVPAPALEPEWLEFDYDDEADEPPVVPWRRRRPTQGEPPVPPERTKR